jgi:hypothetical protein
VEEEGDEERGREDVETLRYFQIVTWSGEV